eukprot:755049-Prymnesium_polylepis.2
MARWTRATQPSWPFSEALRSTLGSSRTPGEFGCSVAPALSRAATHSECPSTAARKSGVMPALSAASVRAWWARSRRVTSSAPAMEARANG